MVLCSVLCAAVAAAVLSPRTVRADSGDAWWDEAWPFRLPVTVAGAGVTQAAVDFGAALAALGLGGEILDVRSVRVVAYAGGHPTGVVPHSESYSVMLENAEAPQIGWSASGVYWTVNDGSAEADHLRFSEGSGSLRALVENRPGGYGYPGVELHLADSHPLKDWRSYEALIYDLWPEVNASALDQAPDLYWFKLYNTSGCPEANITQGGPPLALDRWNRASVSLKPFHTCTTPAFSSITRMEFHTRDNDTVSGNSGLWDDGDTLTLWFDNLRLVDQNGGAVKWQADGSTATYYIYFDILRHEGHPPAAEAVLGPPTVTASAAAAESGGYYHRIAGASTGGLAVWNAPPVEKIGRTQAAPVAAAHLVIRAARGEREAFQLVVRASSAQNLAVGISDFTGGGAPISAGNVSLHRVDYVTLTKISDHFGRLGAWPDPLYPLDFGTPVAFPAGANQPLWFTVSVPADAAPGLYNATITIGSASVPLTLEVWPFALPPAIHLAGEWGFSWSEVVERYRGTVGGDVQPCYWTLVDALYEDFAAHRLTPKGVGWPAGLNYPGGVEYDCNGLLEPDAWGDWGFSTLADQYLRGSALEGGAGFPSFQIRGPASNWPPDSRPSSFCSQSRGTDPPGNAAYNTKWFQYWSAVDDYLADNPDYGAKAYYHIVNEPQSEADYATTAYLARATKTAAPGVRIMVSEQVEAGIYANDTYPGAKIDIWLPTISNYEAEKSHARQRDHGEQVWWYFLYGDRPPLPNPTVMDRPGIEARILPWLAWLERVEGLLYYATTDWSSDPWTQPWINDGNGDGFLFYPPRDTAIAFDPCQARSNRLVPSIRWELLSEGMEDYEYLRLLAGHDPELDGANAADSLAEGFIQSRTRFSRVPTDLAAARIAIAERIGDGDADGSGAVDLRDLVLSLQVASGTSPGGYLSPLADVNGDRMIGSAEAVFVMQRVAGLR
jgi:hypothetical protein